MGEIEKSLPESEMSEWKASWRDEYMKWLAAYAYNDGGKLYIGVNDDGYVIGLRDVRKLQESIPNTIKNKLLISPRVSLRFVNSRGTNIRYDVVPPDISEKDINKYACGTFTPITENEKKKLENWKRENPVYQDPDGRYYYLEIAVDHYPNLVTYNGVAYTRSGSTLQVLEGQELERAVLKSTGLTWDAFEAGGITMGDLSHEAFEAFRKKAVEKKRLTPDQATASDEKLINKLALLTDGKKLMRAAVMLFGNPESIVTGAYIKIGYFAKAGTYGENTINDVIYHDEIRGPLIMQADKAIEFLYSKYLKALISYNGLQRVESYMIPQDAMREIILNAIAHKNYPSGNPIQIKVYDDHITVMNEGFWPFDYIRVEDAYTDDHDSYPSNPNIAEGLYMAGDIETWGSGFEKIKLACSRYGTPLPEIKATKGNITIRINPAESYMKVLNRNNAAAESADYPIESADYPAESADYPIKSADYPAESADCPAESADYPAESADYPAESADYPAESADCPAESADYPAESADYPAESADCPAESADYPAESADYPTDMKPRLKQILDTMQKGKEYSAEQIGEMVSLKGSRTRELMKELVDLGYVETTSGTKGRRYKKK